MNPNGKRMHTPEDFEAIHSVFEQRRQKRLKHDATTLLIVILILFVITMTALLVIFNLKVYEDGSYLLFQLSGCLPNALCSL